MNLAASAGKASPNRLRLVAFVEGPRTTVWLAAGVEVLERHTVAVVTTVAETRAEHPAVRLALADASGSCDSQPLILDVPRKKTATRERGR